MSYEKELAFAKDLAVTAGDMILKGFENVDNVVWKPDNTPLTETDEAINRLTIERIKTGYPDHGVLGEEDSYEPERSKLWVVDPIDGTQPFSIKIPTCVYSLAYVEGGRPKVGVVNDPFTGQLYWASRDGGAFVNGRPLRVSDDESFQGSYFVLSSRMGGDGRVTTGQLFDRIQERGGKTFNFRSIVYGYMTVASGRAAASVAGSIKPWDLAAAQIILEEAGATVTDYDGQPIQYDVAENGVVVSNGKIHQDTLELTKT